MNRWLDLSINSNKFKQSYFQGFVDISGEIHIRNDNNINFYDKSNATNPKFSIKSDSMRIIDNADTVNDISNIKLLYIKDLSENVQLRLDDLNERTKYISTNSYELKTIIINDVSFNKNIYVGGDVSINNNVFINGDMSMNGSLSIGTDLSVNGNVYFRQGSIPATSIAGGIGGVYIANDNIDFDDDEFALVKDGDINGEVASNIIITGTLEVTEDVSFNKNVCIVGDLSMIGNMTAITRPYNDNTTYVATTEYVMNQGYTTPQTLFKQFT
jgi:UDP-3-O-[3-hydroxymyristoyl] glucosamine N-acyltransferase